MASDENMTISDSQQGDGNTPTPRRIDLSNLRDIRLELGHVYRKMDSGGITAAEGTKRAYVLKTISDVIVSAELEQRLQDLEDRHAGMTGGRALPSQPSGRLN